MADSQSPDPTNPSWERVQLARHPKRPHALDYIQRLFTDFQELHGDRAYRDDHAIVAGMGWFDERPVMVDRPAKRPRHQAKAVPQFRHAQAGGLSQGHAR